MHEFQWEKRNQAHRNMQIFFSFVQILQSCQRAYASPAIDDEIQVAFLSPTNFLPNENYVLVA